MGIALDPNFSQNNYIYVMHSYAENNQIYNRVVRLIKRDNVAFIDQTLLDKISGGQIHNGGRIKIGSDNKLYIATGDAGNSALSQDLTSTGGKILRIELDGKIPKDNPFINSPIYSLGHRNPQGLAWNSKNILYASEHGQSAHDEINIIQPGANYGGQQLLSISLNGKGTSVKDVEPWLKDEYGRLREVIQSKDGSIYLATSNRDANGNPDITDDKIIRLIPK